MNRQTQSLCKLQEFSRKTASPGKLLLMLYNAAIRNLDSAVQSISDQDIESAHKSIVRSQEIVAEFMYTLNMDYEISEKLLALYDYLHRRLVEANIHKDVEIINEVRGFLVELRDAWQQAVQKASGTHARVAAAGGGGINLRG